MNGPTRRFTQDSSLDDGPILGLILLDKVGRVKACNKPFADFLSEALGVGSNPADIESVLAAGGAPWEWIATADYEASRNCTLSARDAHKVPSSLRLEQLGDQWLVTVRRADTPKLPLRAMKLLQDHQSSRRALSAYLHDTVCQSFLAVSLLLAKMERDSPADVSRSLIRAREACDLCGGELRTVLRVLSNPLSDQWGVATGAWHPADEICSDLAKGIRLYMAELREQAGLRVSVETSDEQTEVTPEFVCIVVFAALQRWAECSLNNSPSETLVRFSAGSDGTILELLNYRPKDKAIEGVLSYHSLHECVRALGGSVDEIPGRSGSSLRLWIGRAATNSA